MANYDININLPKLNIDNIAPLSQPDFSKIIAQQNEQMQSAMAVIDAANEEKWDREHRELEALEATAQNTAETKERLNVVIDNQNDYINLLKEQLLITKAQLVSTEQQLIILQNIFASNEDGVSVEKEIMKLIQTEIDDQHPLWDYVKDKGGDIAVAGATAGIPVLYIAFKTYLATRGIILP